MSRIDEAIKAKFRIKRGDNLPYTGWANWDRNMLAELFKDVGFTLGAEVGVRKGEYTRILCDANPELKMFCIDPYTAYNRVSNDRQARYFRNAERRLRGCNVEFIKKTSMDALEDIQDRTLDFVYIDGRHEFDFIMPDIIFWSRKVKRGGIVSGHDYYYFYQGGVVDAVNAYTRTHNIQEWYLTQERHPSWFWVNRWS